MGLFSKLKGEAAGQGASQPGNASTGDQPTASASPSGLKKAGQETYEPPPGPPPQLQQQERYQPPPGPPPSHRTGEYQPPPGPPPGHTSRDYHLPGSVLPQLQHQERYQPPTGPPPSHGANEYAPPSGPPPSSSNDPPPYHDWTLVPDTALYPPPPALENYDSPTSNATLDEAVTAFQWCKQNPLFRPQQPTRGQIDQIRNGDVQLSRPPNLKGNLSRAGNGHWKGHTKKDSKDTCILSILPLYFEMEDSPYRTEVRKTVYYEIKVLRLGTRGSSDSSIAIGFCAFPYPTWRMPGWQRGSLAVHSDDGCRYVNDDKGGKDFTSPIKEGETIGLGIQYSMPHPQQGFASSSASETPLDGEVFFTRNGRKDGTWNIHEELDAHTEFGNMGLDGKYDLFAAIGTFGEVEFEAIFESSAWRYRL